MKPLVALSLLVLAGALVTQRSTQARTLITIDAPHVPNRVLVAFKETTSVSTRVATVRRLGLKVAAGPQSPYFAILDVANPGPEDRTGELVAALKADSSVRLAEPDYIVRAHARPNDTRFGEMWGLQNTGQTGGLSGKDIGAVDAWDVVTGSDTLVVGIIDTGVDYNHPDLKDNILKDSSGTVVGFDFINNDADPMDDEGHGTHVAGTVGAVGNNGIGVSGVCQRVKLMPLKILDATGSGPLSAGILAIDFATQRGVKITNNSYGGPGRDDLQLEAIKRARDAGSLFVTAAGNGGVDGVGDDNDTVPDYPGNFGLEVDNVINVAASDHSDVLGSFSNFGARTVNVAAPGVSILSTIRTASAPDPNNAYGLNDGTSMASPHVAGAAALVLANNPSLTYSELKSRIIDTVDPVPAFAGRMTTGGRLNVKRALQSIQVLSPNGGEGFLLNSPVTIGWRTSGFAQPHFVKIEVSINGGVSYTTIADRTEDDGSFTWSGATPTTTLGRIRISSVTAPTVADTSDNTFSIVEGSMTVTRPNGGELALIGSPFRVEWTTVGTARAAGRVRIELSHDGGGTWEDAAVSTENDGSENITITDPETTEARVRVTTIGGFGFTDESDNDFEIRLPPTAHVDSPNGGERLLVDQEETLTWSTTGFTGNVRIELSRDGGTNWATLFPSTPNDGSEVWRVSGPSTQIGRIRVSSVDFVEATDTSDGVFSIEVPAIQVTSPTSGGRALIRGFQTISWDSTGLPDDDDMRVEVSRDSGATWELIDAAAPNLGEYDWQVSGPPTSSAVIRVTSVGSPTVRGLSSTFQVERPNLFLVSPTGRNRWRIGDQQVVEWSGTSVGTGTVDVQLSRDGGRTWSTIIADTPNDGGEAWGVRGPGTRRAVIRVVWKDDPNVKARSRNVFEITTGGRNGRGARRRR